MCMEREHGQAATGTRWYGHGAEWSTVHGRRTPSRKAASVPLRQVAREGVSMSTSTSEDEAGAHVPLRRNGGRFHPCWGLGCWTRQGLV